MKIKIFSNVKEALILMKHIIHLNTYIFMINLITKNNFNTKENKFLIVKIL